MGSLPGYLRASKWEIHLTEPQFHFERVDLSFEVPRECVSSSLMGGHYRGTYVIFFLIIKLIFLILFKLSTTTVLHY